MLTARIFIGIFLLLPLSLTHASHPPESFTSAAPCDNKPHTGPALLIDPALRNAGHPGTSVIDYGQRQPRGEFQAPPGVECRVLQRTTPVAQGIARPAPGQGPSAPNR